MLACPLILLINLFYIDRLKLTSYMLIKYFVRNLFSNKNFEPNRRRLLTIRNDMAEKLNQLRRSKTNWFTNIFPLKLFFTEDVRLIEIYCSGLWSQKNRRLKTFLKLKGPFGFLRIRNPKFLHLCIYYISKKVKIGRIV